jgi:hypothetical protein
MVLIPFLYGTWIILKTKGIWYYNHSYKFEGTSDTRITSLQQINSNTSMTNIWHVPSYDKSTIALEV